jgi:sugar phosphate isomerase/epimerase
MELSIYSNYFADLPLETRLSKIAETGFCYCELDAPIPFPCDKGSMSRKISKLRTHSDKLGLQLHQAHGYWGEFLKPSSREWKRRISLFKDEIAVAAELGVTAIVAHPMNKTKIESAYSPLRPAASLKMVFDHNLEFFSEVKTDLKKNGVKVAIENMPTRYEGLTTIDKLLELLKALESDEFGICIDTGHLNQASGDFTRFISKAGKHLIATHMNDCLNLPGRDLHLFPLFSSYDSWINWTIVRDSLRGIGYKGTFNLETPGEGPTANVPLWMREKKLASVFECLSSFLKQEYMK